MLLLATTSPSPTSSCYRSVKTKAQTINYCVISLTDVKAYLLVDKTPLASQAQKGSTDKEMRGSEKEHLKG